MLPGQTNARLGFPADARLLIVNADDFGMCHAVNAAIIDTLQAGVARSTTVMAPCPWSLHALHWLARHPDWPFGVHLTAVSEWPEYRWGPVGDSGKTPSLLDEAGYFYAFERMDQFLARLDLAELELEWRAQIETVLAAGLRPTHLDWHALRIARKPETFELMIRLAREYGLALRVRGAEWIESLQRQGLPTADYDFLDGYDFDAGTKVKRYTGLLRELPEGLSEWAMHPGLDTPELLAIEPGSNRTRQADYDFLTSQAAHDMIREEGIVLLDYRPLQAVWNAT